MKRADVQVGDRVSWLVPAQVVEVGPKRVVLDVALPSRQTVGNAWVRRRVAVTATNLEPRDWRSTGLGE